MKAIKIEYDDAIFDPGEAMAMVREVIRLGYISATPGVRFNIGRVMVIEDKKTQTAGIYRVMRDIDAEKEGKA